jgi:hypothetical protein
MITGAQRSMGSLCVSGVPIGQYVRVLCSCSVVRFSAVSRHPMRGQSSGLGRALSWALDWSVLGAGLGWAVGWARQGWALVAALGAG